MAGAGGAFDFERIAIKVVVALESFDEEVIEGEPDGSAPVGVAAEAAGFRFAGLVGYLAARAIGVKDKGILLVNEREAADAEGREEFLFVQHAAEDANQALAGRDGEKAVAVLIGGTDFHAADLVVEVAAIFQEPVHPFLEGGEVFDLFFLEHSAGEKGDEANDGVNFKRVGVPVNEKLVVIEAVFFVPEAGAARVFMASAISTKCSKNLEAMSS